MAMTKAQLKEFLDQKALAYETNAFIPHDPIQIPHQFLQKEDIEISGFLTTTESTMVGAIAGLTMVDANADRPCFGCGYI